MNRNKLKKITIKPVKRYEVFADGESLGAFSQESEWEGMLKLKGKGHMVITKPRSFFDLFGEMFGGLPTEPLEVEVITASPAIVAKFIKSEEVVAKSKSRSETKSISE